MPFVKDLCFYHSDKDLAEGSGRVRSVINIVAARAKETDLLSLKTV